MQYAQGWAVKNKGSDTIYVIDSEDVRYLASGGYWVKVGRFHGLGLWWVEVDVPALRDTLKHATKMRVTICKLDNGEIKVF